MGRARRTTSRQRSGSSRSTSSGSLPAGSCTTRTSSSSTPVSSPAASWRISSSSDGRAERPGLLAGRVDVVRERDPLRVPGHERDLVRRQRGAEARDDVLEAGLVGHQGVGVALDDHRLAGLADRALGAVDEVQRPALVEQRGRGRVEVLGAGVAALALLAQDPPAEADRVPVRVPDREDHPLAEPVVDAAAALARAREAGLEQLARVHLALRRELADERVPAAGRPAQLVLLDGLVGEPAAAEVREGRLAGLRVQQDRVVEGDRALEDHPEARAVGVLATGAVVELHAGAARELLERLGEVDASRAPSRT